MAFDACFDLFLNLQNRKLALHLAVNLFQPHRDVQRFQKILFQRHIHAQMARHQIGQPRRFARLGYGRQRFFGDVFSDFCVTLELFGDRAQHGARCGLVARHFIQHLGLRLKEAGVI